MSGALLSKAAAGGRNADRPQAEQKAQQHALPEPTDEELERIYEKMEGYDLENPVNQASKLPPGEIELPEIKNFIGGEENWKEWARNVKRILVANSLDKLINVSIGRPNPAVDSQDEVGKWMYKSKAVAGWLKSSVTEAFEDNLRVSGDWEKLKYADSV